MKYDRENTPLTLLGYKSGVTAGLKSHRQRKVRLAFVLDLKETFSRSDYLASGAEDWGAPKSKKRFMEVYWCLLKWVSEYRDKGWEDAARQRSADVYYLVENFYNESFDFDWKQGLVLHGIELPPSA